MQVVYLCLPRALDLRDSTVLNKEWIKSLRSLKYFVRSRKLVFPVRSCSGLFEFPHNFAGLALPRRLASLQGGLCAVHDGRDFCAL